MMSDWRISKRYVVLACFFKSCSFFFYYLFAKKLNPFEIGDDLDVHIRGKINFALKYAKSNHTLFVKINRCAQLLPMDNGKSSDPFVQMFVRYY